MSDAPRRRRAAGRRRSSAAASRRRARSSAAAVAVAVAVAASLLLLLVREPRRGGCPGRSRRAEAFAGGSAPPGRRRPPPPLPAAMIPSAAPGGVSADLRLRSRRGGRLGGRDFLRLRGPPPSSVAESPRSSASSATTTATTTTTALSAARFARPLLEAGYAPAVLEHESGSMSAKPLLLYLPGFDGTLVAPFLQFPELGTEFDVRGMEVPMDDRSTFVELREAVTEYILGELGGSQEGGGPSSDRPVYLVGESFGGILALEVSQSLRSSGVSNLQGLVLVNPATCFDRSALHAKGPNVASLPPWRYPLGVLSLLPLFTDEYSLPQLWMILSSEALPSVVDTAAREAYMGRTALSLPSKVKFMPRDALQWRLDEWLTTGCRDVRSKMDDGSLRRDLGDLPVLVVAGERDGTLPSVEEAERLATSGALRDAKVAVVDGAGHASTLGSRVDLAAEMRARFPPLRANGGRTAMKAEAARGAGTKEFGMEPRYDGGWIGLNPLKYWSEEYFKRIQD